MQLVELRVQGEGDLGSLMLVQTPMRPRMPALRKAGPCFGCGGEHWLQDYETSLSLAIRGKDYLLLSVIV